MAPCPFVRKNVSSTIQPESEVQREVSGSVHQDGRSVKRIGSGGGGDDGGGDQDATSPSLPLKGATMQNMTMYI